MVLDWLDEPEMCAETAALDYVDTAQIRRRAPAALAGMAPFVEQIFTRFGDLCQRRAPDHEVTAARRGGSDSPNEPSAGALPAQTRFSTRHR